MTCDDLTQDDSLNGRLNVEIGMAPLRPAEYVMLRTYLNHLFNKFICEIFWKYIN